jgi:hypothetical protein
MYPPCERDDNAESRFFKRANRALLAGAGLDWNRVRGAEAIVAPEGFEDGWWLVHFRGCPDAEGPWGWKSPTTTALWRVWDRVFPEASWLRIVRNGLDVAESLYRRHMGPEGWTLSQCYEVWEQYVAHGNEAQAALGERCRMVRYEELVASGEFEVRGGEVPESVRREREELEGSRMLVQMGYA